MTTEPPEKAPPGDNDVTFETLWGRVLDAWDDDRTHAALLDYAMRTQRLAEAAGRYRAMKSDPARAEGAQKRLDAIVLAATQMLFSTMTPARGKIPRSITLSLLGICASVLAWLAMLLLRR